MNAYNEIIDKIKDSVDIVEIVSEYITLDANHKSHCPFHSENTPSFSVNEDGQYFHCFGCGVGGDVIRFLELYEKKSFLQVLKELAMRVGLSIHDHGSEGERSLENFRQQEEIQTESARFYHENLSETAKEYLLNVRGLSEEMISRFQIGYADGKLYDHLVNKCGYPLELCLEAGVLKKSPDGSIRDYFYERIIFPVVKSGRVVYLTGRTLGNNEPKYLHLPGRIKYLYNEDALKAKEVILAEGPIDCITAVQAGYNTVAILGASAFKDGYLEKFSRCESIYVCMDADDAGRKAAIAIADKLGDRAKVVTLPDGMDLNDFFKSHSPADFEKLLSEAKPCITYLLEMIPEDTPKTELARMLQPILRRLAAIEGAQCEAYLNYEIKDRFKLKTRDVQEYRETIKKVRKQREKAAQKLNDASSGLIIPLTKARFDGLIDLVLIDGKPGFLVQNEVGLSATAQVLKGSDVIAPPPMDQIPWLLPRAEEVIKHYENDNDQQLYDDLIAYHKSISELPGEEYYDLLVAWDFHSYLLEQFEYSPIICLYAVPERGKSRTGKGLIYVAYRGIHVESLRDAYLVRIAENLQASVFFDVMDIWSKAEKQGSEDILLHRFEKGARVPRVLYPERGAFRDIVYYSIFGPTVVSTNKAIHHILETRAILINMPEAERKFEIDLKPEHGLELKERLVAFRARHFASKLPDVTKIAHGRLGDILKPLHQMILLVRPDRAESLLRLSEILQKERILEKSEGLEAEILMAVRELEGKVIHGFLSVKEITDTLNVGRPENRRLTYQKVGRLLKAMGFKKGRKPDGAIAIFWNLKLIKKLETSYGLAETSVTPVSPETSISTTKAI